MPPPLPEGTTGDLNRRWNWPLQGPDPPHIRLWVGWLRWRDGGKLQPMSDTVLTKDQVEAAGLADWRSVIGTLQTRFRTGDFATGLQLVNQIGEAAEAANHHPDLDLRYPHLNVRLSSHDVGGVTERDLQLARTISELAAGLGVSAAPADVAAVELALDTPDHARIKPFWLAVLDGQPNPNADDEVRDGGGDRPTIWFQQSGDEAGRQRWHLDVRVPKEVAQARVDAAVAAGGEVLEQGQNFVTLADPDGNKVCVCT